MQPTHIHDFLQRFADDLYTEDEHRLFLDWIRSANMDEVEEIAGRYQSIMEGKAPLATADPELVAGIEESLDRVDRNRRKSRPVYKMTWFRVAASILLVASVTGLYFAFRHTRQDPAMAQADTKVPAADVTPGSNRAILIKSDGSEVLLEDRNNEKIKEKNGQEIANKNGTLNYAAGLQSAEGAPGTQTAPEASGGPGSSGATGSSAGNAAFARADKPVYNTVRVPRRGQYQLVLADGTKVWLNAESSLTYPTVFTGDRRSVNVTGEAYFEVAKDAGRPFHVTHQGLDVQVLGTNFNINSYEDETDTKVTLLEGSVNVTSLHQNAHAPVVKLKPGQQARQHADGMLTMLPDADLEEVMAWKDGRFQFRDSDLKMIMRQLMRWYDIEVEYHGKIPDRYFTADISRNKNLSSVIKILELSDIHCSIDHQKLIVTP